MSDDRELLKEEKTEQKDNKKREDEYEKVCFLCRRPESKTGPMITLPQNIHICTDCMQKSFDSMNNNTLNYGDLMNHMPNMGMIDLSSVPNQVQDRQRVRKKRKMRQRKHLR